MLKYQDTYELSELTVQSKNNKAARAIDKEIRIYAISTRKEIQLIPLHPGQIQHIKTNSSNENKTVVKILDTNDTLNDLYPTGKLAEILLSQGKAVKASLDDLRICKSDVSPSELQTISDARSVLSSHMIWGLVLKILFEVTNGGQSITIFKNQSRLLEYLVDNFNNIHGVSRTSIENEFSKANKSIKNLNLNTPVGV